MAPVPDRARVFVKNLPHDIKEKEVKYIFSKYGTLVSADLIMWPGTPQLGPGGTLQPTELASARKERPQWTACAFVAYSSAEKAATAIRALNGVYKVRSSSTEPVSVSVVSSGTLPDAAAQTALATTTSSTPIDKAALSFSGAPSSTFSDQAGSATASFVAEKTRCKLFVGNLSADLAKETLAAVFGAYGRVISTHVMTGKSKFGSACAYVEMATPKEADLAVASMHQKHEPRIGTGSAPITVTYFQSQSSGKAGQPNTQSSRFAPY